MALAFIGQIQTEHKAVLKADGEALKHAIECGKMMRRAHYPRASLLVSSCRW